MKSETPDSSVRSLSPVEQALLDVALQTACSTNPAFSDEIDHRLIRATLAVECLVCICADADSSKTMVFGGPLYGVTDLILNELRAVQILSQRRDAIERASIAARTAGEVAL